MVRPDGVYLQIVYGGSAKHTCSFPEVASRQECKVGFEKSSELRAASSVYIYISYSCGMVRLLDQLGYDLLLDDRDRERGQGTAVLKTNFDYCIRPFKLR